MRGGGRRAGGGAPASTGTPCPSFGGGSSPAPESERELPPPTVPRRLAALRELLYGPAVSVRVGEEDERAPVEFLDIARFDPPLDELRARGVDIGDDELKALDGPRRHLVEPGPDRDRAGRAA